MTATKPARWQEAPVVARRKRRWLIRRTRNLRTGQFTWWVIDTHMHRLPEPFSSGAEAFAAFARGDR